MKRIVFLVLVVVVVAGVSAATWWRRGPGPLTASGTLEARNITVGSKAGGRVSRVLANEGDHVKPGQVMVEFEDAELGARLLQARGRFQQAQANLAKMEHGSRPEEIAEARASGASGYPAHELEVAQAELAQAQADAVQAQRDYQRYRTLAAEGVVSRQLLDQAQARYDSTRAAVETRRHAIAAAQGRLQAASAVEQRVQHGFRREDIAAARAELTSAEGDLKEAETMWEERVVKSPANAVVEVLDIRPGDLLPPNAGVAKLLESDQLFVMVYVPENLIGAVRVGQAAAVTVDAYPDSFSAKVEQIRQRAEFLPRNVQTREEREHQVIGVKLRVDNRDSKLRPGISANVRFEAAK